MVEDVTKSGGTSDPDPAASIQLNQTVAEPKNHSEGDITVDNGSLGESDNSGNKGGVSKEE